MVVATTLTCTVAECGRHPWANTLRYILFFLTVTTVMAVVAMLMGRFIWGRSFQMPGTLFDLVNVFVLGASLIFLFSEIGSLNTSVSWQLVARLVTIGSGLLLYLRLLRGDFLRDEDHADTPEDVIRSIKDRHDRSSRGTIRRRTGRR